MDAERGKEEDAVRTKEEDAVRGEEEDAVRGKEEDAVRGRRKGGRKEEAVILLWPGKVMEFTFDFSHLKSHRI